MTDDPRADSLYDDPEFFAGYSQLERFDKPWGDAYEHGAFQALLPDVQGLRALDLGCGTGALTLHLAESGAAEVVGLDASERMLDRARTARAHPRVTYVRRPMETAHFPASRFDLVVSSLAFHYVADYRGLMASIGEWLTPGGTLVFSTEHPIYLARATDDGWMRDADGQPAGWTITGYGNEGLREEHWFRPGVQKYARMLSTLLNGVIDAALTIDRVVEPMPMEDQLRDHPEWVHERLRPIFLLVRAHKPLPDG
jgi:SAM-dependent methyltransferase